MVTVTVSELRLAGPPRIALSLRSSGLLSSMARASAAASGFSSAARPVSWCVVVAGLIAVVTVAAVLVFSTWTTVGVWTVGGSAHWRTSPSAPLSRCPAPTFLHLLPPLVHQKGEQQRCQQLGVEPAAPPASAAAVAAYPEYVLPVHDFLITFPRSGNTMIRKILEDATGVLTGSVYGDVLLLKAGLRGEMNMSHVLLLKHHFLDFTHQQVLTSAIHNAADPSPAVEAKYGIERFIYGVRDPMDSMVSYFLFGATGGHDTTLGSIDLAAFLHHLMAWLPAWAAHVRYFTSELLRDPGRCRGCRHIVVKYEDFLIDSNSLAAVRSRLLCFLGYPLSRGCAPANAGSSNSTVTYRVKTRRSILNSTVGIPRNISYASEIFSVLKPEQIAAIDGIAGQQMRQFGYWPSEHNDSSDKNAALQGTAATTQ